MKKSRKFFVTGLFLVGFSLLFSCASAPQEPEPAAAPEEISKSAPPPQLPESSAEPAPEPVPPESALPEPALTEPALTEPAPEPLIPETAPEEEEPLPPLMIDDPVVPAEAAPKEEPAAVPEPVFAESEKLQEEPQSEELPASETQPEKSAETAEIAESDPAPILTPESEALPAPSRSVTLYVGQYLDIPCPGYGWVYLGEVENQRLVSYVERRQAGNNTTFTIRADKPGTALLQFYKNDRLSNAALNDYFEVTIAEIPVISAPSQEFPTAAEPDAPQSPEQPQEAPPAAEPEAPAEAAPEVSEATETPIVMDSAQALFQEAQKYEANSPDRDIRRALQLYQQLVGQFPESPQYQEAQKRIQYLRRFYFTIN
ncbi:MAG: hypothetical protein LBS97_03445 [Treponema sp.]|jgi:hypothetical protein|nr:hypothetical protein [Treponema sp.]